MAQSPPFLNDARKRALSNATLLLGRLGPQVPGDYLFHQNIPYCYSEFRATIITGADLSEVLEQMFEDVRTARTQMEIGFCRMIGNH
jgi:hypothetical protein